MTFKFIPGRVDIPVTPAQGGTGFSSYTIGDMLYANSTTSLAKMAIGPYGSVLGTYGSTPAWSSAVNIGNFTLNDSFATSIDWINRWLADASGVPMLYWSTTGLSLTTAGATFLMYDGNSYQQTIGTQHGSVPRSFMFPADDGTGGYVLQTDGAGNTYWGVAPTGSVVIGSTAVSGATPYATLYVDSGSYVGYTFVLYDSASTSSVDIASRVLFDGGPAQSVDWGNRILKDASSVSTLDWSGRNLVDTGAVVSVSWNSRALVDSGGFSVADWDAKTLIANGVVACDWDNWSLYDSVGTASVGWQTRGLANASGGTTLVWEPYVHWQGSNTNDSASGGENGEFINSAIAVGSAVTLTTATAKTVTSISLTAGDWDVRGIVCLNGTLTGTQFIAAIGQTTNSLTGTTLGDSQVATPTMSTAASDVSQTISAIRVSLAATTTIYLIAQATFTAGTAKAYGRISARRAR